MACLRFYWNLPGANELTHGLIEAWKNGKQFPEIILNKFVLIQISIFHFKLHWSLFLKCQVQNKSALVKVKSISFLKCLIFMAQEPHHTICNKQLSDQVLTQISECMVTKWQ